MVGEKHVDASPLVEGHDGKSISRWTLILDKYQNIKNLVTLHDHLMSSTNLKYTN